DNSTVRLERMRRETDGFPARGGLYAVEPRRPLRHGQPPRPALAARVSGQAVIAPGGGSNPLVNSGGIGHNPKIANIYGFHHLTRQPQPPETPTATPTGPAGRGYAPRRKPAMSMLGKVLAVLNVLAAIAFLVIAGMD